MRVISLLCAFIMFSLVVNAQKNVITGKVIDKKNNKPIGFVNLGIEGTYVGASTDEQGVFNLQIPSGLEDRDLVISAIGFKAFKVKTGDYLDKKDVVFKLESTSYDLVGVDITAESKSRYRIIRDAGINIKYNYYNKPFNQQLFYNANIQAKVNNTKYAIYTVSEKKGIVRQNAKETFENRKYALKQLKKKVKSESLIESTINLDEILKFDIVRQRGNILDMDFIEDFEIEVKKGQKLKDQAVYVVNYKCKNPKLYNTGFNNVEKYRGVIYIDQASSAILKNEIWVKSNKENFAGISVASDVNKIKSVERHIETTYKKVDKKYVLDKISCNKSIKLNDNTSEKINIYIVAGNIEQYASITNNQYLENVEEDTKFWNLFKIPAVK